MYATVLVRTFSPNEVMDDADADDVDVDEDSDDDEVLSSYSADIDENRLDWNCSWKDRVRPPWRNWFADIDADDDDNDKDGGCNWNAWVTFINDNEDEWEDRERNRTNNRRRCILDWMQWWLLVLLMLEWCIFYRVCLL